MITINVTQILPARYSLLESPHASSQSRASDIPSPPQEAHQLRRSQRVRRPPDLYNPADY